MMTSSIVGIFIMITCSIFEVGRFDYFTNGICLVLFLAVFVFFEVTFIKCEKEDNFWLFCGINLGMLIFAFTVTGGLIGWLIVLIAIFQHAGVVLKAICPYVAVISGVFAVKYLIWRIFVKRVLDKEAEQKALRKKSRKKKAGKKRK